MYSYSAFIFIYDNTGFRMHNSCRLKKKCFTSKTLSRSNVVNNENGAGETKDIKEKSIRI